MSRRPLTAAECLAAADALEGALHIVGCDECAQQLALLADQWRAEASRCPACGVVAGHGLVHIRHGNDGGHNEPCPPGR